MFSRNRVHLLLWPSLLLLIAFFLIPSALIVRTSVLDPEFTLRHFEVLATRKVYWSVFAHTTTVSLTVAVLSALVGYPAAYFINSRPPRQQIFLLFLIFVPLWISVLVRSYSWIVALGREGIVNSLLMQLGFTEEPIKLLYTTSAVYVAMLQILLPVQIVACYSSMTEIDRGLVHAARILGASPIYAFKRVFFPLSLHGLVTGTVIVFMLSMGFFVTPALVGGRKDIFLGNLIEYHVGQLNWGFASSLAVLLVAGALTFVPVIRVTFKFIARATR